MLDEQVAVERHDRLALVEARDRPHRPLEGERGPGALVVPRQRLVLVPLDRELRGQPLLERAQRRRRRCFGEHVRSAVLQRVAQRWKLGPERFHRSAAAVVRRVLRAIRVIEVKDRRLHECMRTGAPLRAGNDATAGERVLRVAVEVNRPTLVRRREERVPDAGELVRGGVLQRRARNLILGPASERDDVFLLVALAGADARERHARAHEVEEIAPRHRIGRAIDDAVGELLARRLQLPGGLAI